MRCAEPVAASWSWLPRSRRPKAWDDAVHHASARLPGDCLHPPTPVVSPHAASRGAADAASIGAAARVLPPRRTAALCGAGTGALVLRRRPLRGSAPAGAMAVSDVHRADRGGSSFVPRPPQYWPAGPHRLRVRRARCTGERLPGGSRDEDDGAAVPCGSPALPGAHWRSPGNVAATGRGHAPGASAAPNGHGPQGRVRGHPVGTSSFPAPQATVRSNGSSRGHPYAPHPTNNPERR